jgi:Protein of unknown function (DUF998)
MLMQNIPSMNRVTVNTPDQPRAKLTRALLTCGIIVGPLYTIVGLIQAFTRPGFDITRHVMSILSNGSLGWIQISNFIVTGLLLMAGAVGIRRALHTGHGRVWGPLLIGIYGFGMIGAGIFTADPALGFPPGTPADAHAISWHGLLHFAFGGVGFLALIAACFVFARRFAALKQRNWQVFSLVTGLVFFAGFFGIASGSGNGWTIFGFWIAVLLGWSWLSLLSAQLLKTER